MRIVVANAERIWRQRLMATLSGKGYVVSELETGQLTLLQNQLAGWQRTGYPADLVIVADYHQGRDLDGRIVYTLPFVTLVSWLRRQSLFEGAHYLLYSTDQEMVQRLQNTPRVSYWQALARPDHNDLPPLLRAIEDFAQRPSNPVGSRLNPPSECSQDQGGFANNADSFPAFDVSG